VGAGAVVGGTFSTDDVGAGEEGFGGAADVCDTGALELAAAGVLSVFFGAMAAPNTSSASTPAGIANRFCLNHGRFGCVRRLVPGWAGGGHEPCGVSYGDCGGGQEPCGVSYGDCGGGQEPCGISYGDCGCAAPN
jgi:hypothetical protein